VSTQTEMAGLMLVGPPPQGGDSVGILRWCNRLFAFLTQFLREPEFSVVRLTQNDAVLPADFKAQDGMLMYAGAGMLGASAGLYVRDGGTWKKIALT
jgi:hypothetical protein